MSIHVSDCDDEADSYADLRVQQVAIKTTIQSGQADASPSVIYDIPILRDAGLQNDELAELVALERDIVCGFRSNSQNETAPPAVEVEGGLGVNMSEPEEFTTEGNAPVTTTVDGTNVVKILGSTENAAELDIYHQNASPFYDDDTTAGGGAGFFAGSPYRKINYRDEFGQGPILDANDELNAKQEVDTHTVDNAFRTLSSYTLYWDVREVEGARQPFGL